MGRPSQDSFPAGIVMNESIDRRCIAEIEQVITSRSPCGTALILASPLMLPILKQVLPDSIAGARLYYSVPLQNYWGGSMVVGDLLTARDYLKAIERWVAEHRVPDLIILPASPFGRWGFDLAGDE